MYADCGTVLLYAVVYSCNFLLNCKHDCKSGVSLDVLLYVTGYWYSSQSVLSTSYGVATYSWTLELTVVKRCADDGYVVHY